uniref:Uncharacterized protein n=1 Tax=Meloidogyne javanica TaxID=6303 RepID=A0A915NF22_MELJA
MPNNNSTRINALEEQNRGLMFTIIQLLARLESVEGFLENGTGIRRRRNCNNCGTCGECEYLRIRREDAPIIRHQIGLQIVEATEMIQQNGTIPPNTFESLRVSLGEIDCGQCGECDTCVSIRRYLRHQLENQRLREIREEELERENRVVQNPVRYVDELERLQRREQQQQQNSDVQFVWEGPSYLARNPTADYLDLDNQPGTSGSSSRLS